MAYPFLFVSWWGFPEDCPRVEANKVKGTLLFIPFDLKDNNLQSSENEPNKKK